MPVPRMGVSFLRKMYATCIHEFVGNGRLCPEGYDRSLQQIQWKGQDPSLQVRDIIMCLDFCPIIVGIVGNGRLCPEGV